ncbi:type 4a pilus biogenesis protein PilO [Halochromatium salexigens]|uniref:Pilus assembly protein PilO n=1 Tax=Halochromatium salexigens TaxID=49447 RepID=A0AAJ0UHS6_HALSE|nr:type 4a pilus biogenesis protein PilO [Halochromatium salexigens]MBK5931750.1 pilus assembly protein PilO [Halochromatium salexigens]
MDLNALDVNTIGDWPMAAKAVLIAMGCGLVGVGWYQFVTSDQLERLSGARQQELELKQRLERKQPKAANLEAYRQQLAEMEVSFGNLLRQLPDETEVASLLVDVSRTGRAAGLEFELFQPSAEATQDFYAERPIRVRVSGRYHEFATFISGLASLPRIVTVHNIQIEHTKRPGGAMGVMSLSATVQTYRYLGGPGAG